MSPLMYKVVTMMIVVLFAVGLDLLLGAKVLVFLGRLFNRKLDVDSLVIRSLAGIRSTGEKEVFRIDEQKLQARLRIFLAVLLLVPAGMLFFVVFVRR